MSPCPNSRRDQGYRVLIDDPCVGHREGVTEIKQSGADLHVAYFDNSAGIDPFRALCPSNISGGLLGMDALAGPAVSIQSDGCPSRKSYPRVAMMQSGQDWYSDDGPRSLDGSS